MIETQQNEPTFNGRPQKSDFRSWFGQGGKGQGRKSPVNNSCRHLATNPAWNKLKEVGKVGGTTAVGRVNNPPERRVNEERKAKAGEKGRGEAGWG